MNIDIRTVPNDEIKLRKGFTGADWWWDAEGVLQIRVAAEIGDKAEIDCLITHELVEALLCRHMGVSQEAVDEFDLEYQRTHKIDLNAGDESDAPYQIPHTFATAAERIMAGALGVDWKSYDNKLSVI
jgi:hypothetical protein